MQLKLETVLYAVGGLFAVATIIYFAWEYLVVFPRWLKATLLALLVVLFIFLGKWLEERDI